MRIDKICRSHRHRLSIIHAIACWLLTLTAFAQAAPSIPTTDDIIVERLRDRPLDPSDRNYRQLRAQLREHPSNLQYAVAVARRSIDISRRDGDPRYLGYAQAALTPWWSSATSPAAARLLKAVILQSNHAFDAALAELDQVLRIEPRKAQAWLTRASILQVRGEYEQAARSCDQLRPLGATLYADACAAELASLSGQTEQASALFKALEAQVERQPWLAISFAEYAERQADLTTAERYYRQALKTGDVYAKGAYADFLLDRGRPAEVISLLKNEQRVDPLLLRLALAEQADQHVDLASTVALLQARFAAARARGDRVHRREEARFTLHLLQQPAAALDLALANWAVQKEPADARVVLEAAQAAKLPEQAEPVRQFIRDHQWSDQRLKRLMP